MNLTDFIMILLGISFLGGVGAVSYTTYKLRKIYRSLREVQLSAKRLTDQLNNRIREQAEEINSLRHKLNNFLMRQEAERKFAERRNKGAPK